MRYGGPTHSVRGHQYHNTWRCRRRLGLHRRLWVPRWTPLLCLRRGSGECVVRTRRLPSAGGGTDDRCSRRLRYGDPTRSVRGHQSQYLRVSPPPWAAAAPLGSSYVTSHHLTSPHIPPSPLAPPKVSLPVLPSQPPSIPPSPRRTAQQRLRSRLPRRASRLHHARQLEAPEARQVRAQLLAQPLRRAPCR